MKVQFLILSILAVGGIANAQGITSIPLDRDVVVTPKAANIFRCSVIDSSGRTLRPIYFSPSASVGYSVQTAHSADGAVKVRNEGSTLILSVNDTDVQSFDFTSAEIQAGQTVITPITYINPETKKAAMKLSCLASADVKLDVLIGQLNRQLPLNLYPGENTMTDATTPVETTAPRAQRPNLQTTGSLAPSTQAQVTRVNIRANTNMKTPATGMPAVNFPVATTAPAATANR